MHESFEEDGQEWEVGEPLNPQDLLEWKTEFPAEFDVWFQDWIGKVTTADLLSVIGNLMVRCRANLTQLELVSWITSLLNAGEYALQHGVAFKDDEGNPQNMLLAEEREELGVETIEVPDTIEDLE